MDSFLLVFSETSTSIYWGFYSRGLDSLFAGKIGMYASLHSRPGGGADLSVRALVTIFILKYEYSRSAQQASGSLAIPVRNLCNN